jgi:TfoX/Sxy family transcriptional regulator of competence genes
MVGVGFMGTAQSFVDFVVDQVRLAGHVTSRKMFGEHALYCDGKVVALLCDNRLFVKVTEAGRSLVGKVNLAPPYPGAKPSMLIEDRLEDSDFLAELIRVTAKELPPAKPKKKTVTPKASRRKA